MQRCLELAQLGQYYVAPNPMVGATLVAPDGKILAEGWHRIYGGPHAEVNCFAQAEKLAISSERLADCTLYVSLEPCSHYGKTPPCADLIISKGVKRVVVGMLDPNPKVAGRGIDKLQAAGIEVKVGVLEKECRELNKRFICLHENKRPYVVLKWAQTEEGYMDGVISNAETKQIVHKIRAENMAIMVGTRTVLNDNPKLTVTHWSGRNPIRVVTDRHGVIPHDANIFNDAAETIVYRDNTDWTFILSDLAKRNIHSIMVEGGPTLLNHILASDLWDEMHVEIGAHQQQINENTEHRALNIEPIANSPRPTAPIAPMVRLPKEPYAVIDGNALYKIER